MEDKPQVVVIGDGNSNKQMNIIAATLLVAGMEIHLSDGLPKRYRKQSKKPEKECLLIGCDKLTSHNGGYCCAGHKKQSKQLEG